MGDLGDAARALRMLWWDRDVVGGSEDAVMGWGCQWEGTLRML